MVTDQRKRLLVTALIALLAICGVGVAALAGRDEPDENAGVAIVEGRERTAFRGGALPPGVSGKAAPHFALDDARAGRVDTRRLQGRPYVNRLRRSRFFMP